MARAQPMAGAAFAALCAAVVGCSILAPSDDEYLGGSQATGGTGAASSGGASGAASGGASGSGGSVVTGGTGGGGASGGTGGGGASGGVAGSSSGGASGSGGSGATAGTGGGSCVAGTTTAQPQPVALYAIVDRTQSVTGSPEWGYVESGFGQFVDAATSAGISIGLQYFPLSAGQCSGTGFDTPDVSIAVLPGNASAIKSSLAGSSTTLNNELMDGVIQGGLSACKAYSNAHGDAQCNLVLVSDYDGANACSMSDAALASLLTNAWSTAPSVMTYVARLATSTPLNQFASAGGTGSTLSATSAAALAYGLRRAATPCRYDLPANASGGSVTWQRNGTALTEVSGPSACATANNGNQYYLTSSAMVLCPRTCSVLQGPSSATVTATVTCN